MRKFIWLFFCFLLPACSADQKNETNTVASVTEMNNVVQPEAVKANVVLAVPDQSKTSLSNKVVKQAKPTKATGIQNKKNKVKASKKNVNHSKQTKLVKHSPVKTKKATLAKHSPIKTKKAAITKYSPAKTRKNVATKSSLMPSKKTKIALTETSQTSPLLANVAANQPYTLANAWKDYWKDYSLASPGISFGSPTAYGANWGDVFGGIGVISRSPTTSAADDSAVIGFGLGDADKYVGLEIATAITGIDVADNTFAQNGNFAFKLHRNLPNNFAVALGVQSIGNRGTARTEKETYYVSGTKVFITRPGQPSNPMPLFVTVGMGNGLYRNQGDQGLTVSNDHYGPFGAVAWHFVPRAGVVADYSAEKLNLGVSVAPFNPLPITMTVGALDVTGRKSSKLAWAVTAGLVYNFKNI